MQSDLSIYFTLVPVIPCAIISALPAENRRYTLEHLISPVLWDSISPVYFTTWNKNKKTQVTFGNCCYNLFGLSLEPCPKLPELSVTSRHQINSNVLCVWSVSTGKCTKSEVSYCITKSPHAFSFKRGPEKKTTVIPDGAKNIQSFVIYPLQLKFGNVSLCCVRFFLGGTLNRLNTAGRLDMQGIFQTKHYWCEYVFISFPVGHKNDLKL